MTAQLTQIFVASRDANTLTIVAPGYRTLATSFLSIGLICFLSGLFLLLFLRERVPGAFSLLLAVTIAAPFIAVSLFTGRSTQITMVVDANELQVRQSLFSLSLKTRVYPLNGVRGFVLGVGDACRSVQVAMADGSGDTLIGCTDRTGYNLVIEAMNHFLAEHRGASPPDSLVNDQ